MKTFTLSIPGLNIAGKAWGNPQLPPMLALHGWLDNANSFDLLAPYLAKHYYFMAVDFPGHGLSSHLPEMSHYHFIDGLLNIIQIIKALGYPKIHLLGHSLGACMASLIAGIIPERILSLSLIEGLGPFSSPGSTCCEQLTHYVNTTLLQEPVDVRPYPSKEMAAHARAKRGHVSFEIASILCERGVKEIDGFFYWQHDRRLIMPSPLRLTEEQVLSFLVAITAPTTLIWADNGFKFDLATLDNRLKAVKDIKVYLLPGGHHLHMETPDAVAQHLVAKD